MKMDIIVLFSKCISGKTNNINHQPLLCFNALFECGFPNSAKRLGENNFKG